MNVWKPENGIPIKSWCEDIEDGAKEQAINLARHPSMFHHVALMPDCHQGYGMPIGGVIASRDVIPNAVGVDIGCGMLAINTNISVSDITSDNLKHWMGKIRKIIPVGFSHHEHAQEWEGFDEAPDIPVIKKELQKATRQLGTLGGGNHFIEFQESDTETLWVMLHSGSRNFGYKIAKHYNELAQELCSKFHSVVCPFKGEDGLAFLPHGSDWAQEYIEAMNYALSFALENRWAMMRSVLRAIGIEYCDSEPAINIHHNYAVLENHFGQNVWIHRKGATSARKDEMGIIPGSMGTSSYIVKGLGNPDSFQSCSHGAGRRMGRKRASQTLTVEDCDRAMDGIIFGRWGKDRKGNVDLGEAPQAYKDIDKVMESQSDLVKIVTKLKPLAVIKG